MVHFVVHFRAQRAMMDVHFAEYAALDDKKLESNAPEAEASAKDSRNPLHMTIRMKDIAKDLGISQATVSKVLRAHPDIGERTRRRVLDRVKELDYQPNSLARSLVTGRSYLIGLVAPSLLHPFFAQIARGLSSVVRDKGYSLIVSSSEEIRSSRRRKYRDCWRGIWMH